MQLTWTLLQKLPMNYRPREGPNFTAQRDFFSYGSGRVLYFSYPRCYTNYEFRLAFHILRDQVWFEMYQLNMDSTLELSGWDWSGLLVAICIHLSRSRCRCRKWLSYHDNDIALPSAPLKVRTNTKMFARTWHRYLFLREITFGSKSFLTRQFKLDPQIPIPS